jgi:MFS family permease
MGSEKTSDLGAGGYLALVRGNANFRNLWFGQIISLLGDWFNLIASASLLGQLSNSGIAIGGLFVVRMLAPFLISPLAGVAADRFNRKHILILSDLARAVVVLGFLLVRAPEQVWLLYALTAVQLAIGGVFFPTRSAILPDIVSEEELGAANALTSATWSVMLALGAALGGLVAGGWGNYPAFIVDSATFLLSAFFLLRILYEPNAGLGEKGGKLRDALRQYIDGLRYLRHHPDVLVISLNKPAFHITLSGPFTVVQVALAADVFVIGEGGGISLGIIMAITGVGTGLGPIIARRFSGDRSWALRRSLLVAYFISVIGLLVAAPLKSFGLLLVGNALRSVGGGIAWVFSTQLLLQMVPGEMRGRVFSTEFALFTLASAAGATLGGWWLDHEGIGLQGSLYWMAGLTVIPGVLWLLWLLRGGHEEPLPASEDKSSALMN